MALITFGPGSIESSTATLTFDDVLNVFTHLAADNTLSTLALTFSIYDEVAGAIVAARTLAAGASISLDISLTPIPVPAGYSLRMLFG